MFLFESVHVTEQHLCIQAGPPKFDLLCAGGTFPKISVHFRNFKPPIKHDNKFSWTPDRCWRIRLDLK